MTKNTMHQFISPKQQFSIYSHSNHHCTVWITSSLYMTQSTWNQSICCELLPLNHCHSHLMHVFSCALGISFYVSSFFCNHLFPLHHWSHCHLDVCVSSLTYETFCVARIRMNHFVNHCRSQTDAFCAFWTFSSSLENGIWTCKWSQN